MKQYSYKISIYEKTEEGEEKVCMEITSPRWYDRVFRTAVAIIWAMEQLKFKVRGKEK